MEDIKLIIMKNIILIILGLTLFSCSETIYERTYEITFTNGDVEVITTEHSLHVYEGSLKSYSNFCRIKRFGVRRIDLLSKVKLRDEALTKHKDFRVIAWLFIISFIGWCLFMLKTYGEI